MLLKNKAQNSLEIQKKSCMTETKGRGRKSAVRALCDREEAIVNYYNASCSPDITVTCIMPHT